MQTAIDPLTGETFTQKRSDQRFATRANQIKYNNEKAREKRKQMASVNKILDTNRSVLKRILGDQEKVIKSYDFLLGAGFNFGCITHSISRDGHTWQCVYDFAYRNIKNRDFQIIKVS